MLFNIAYKPSTAFSLLVVNDLADAVEHLLVVWLHLHGVGPLAEHQEQHGVRDKVKPGEPRSLLLQVALKALLALLQLHEEDGEGRAQSLAGATRGDLFRLLRCVCGRTPRSPICRRIFLLVTITTANMPAST